MRSTYHGRTPLHLVRGAFIACAWLTTLACAKADKSGTDSTAARSDTARSTAATVPARQTSGELTKPIANYTAKEFASFVDSLSWTGHYYPRDCSGGGCSGNAKAEVLLEAISDAHQVDVANLPPNGVLMARMINVGKFKEKHYGIPTGGGEWYFLYYQKNGEKLFNFVKLTFDQNGDPTVYWDETPHPFAPCGTGPDDPNHPKPNRAYAGFTGCDPHRNPRETFSLNKNVWISCSLGCCSSEYPGFDPPLTEAQMPFGTPKVRPSPAAPATTP